MESSKARTGGTKRKGVRSGASSSSSSSIPSSSSGNDAAPQGISAESLAFHIDSLTATFKDRPLQESELDLPLLCWTGSSSNLHTTSTFALLTVVELPIDCTSIADYKGVKVNEGMVELVQGAIIKDSLYGTACQEKWQSNRPNNLILVRDLMALVLERFRVQHPADSPLPGAIWGRTRRTVVIDVHKEPARDFRLDRHIGGYMTMSL